MLYWMTVAALLLLLYFAVVRLVLHTRFIIWTLMQVDPAKARVVYAEYFF